MLRMRVSAWMLSLFLPVVLSQEGFAQVMPAGGAVPTQASGVQVPGRFAMPGQARPIQYQQTVAGEPVPIGPPSGEMVPVGPPMGGGRGYPHFGAPLYPAPQPGIPYQTGITVIPNEALAPHEMLHSHTYRGLHPPYFHHVKGSWVWTPFGIRSHDKWKLVGTKVNVKYRPKYGLFSGFHPPAIRGKLGW